MNRQPGANTQNTNNSSTNPVKKQNPYNSFNINLVLREIGDIETIPGQNGDFRKRTIVGEHTEMYNGEPRSNFFKFDMGGNAVDKVNGIKAGDFVNVRFTVRGAKYTPESGPKAGIEQVFSSLNAYAIELLKSKNTVAQNAHVAQLQGDIPNHTGDDLPY